MFKKYDSIEDYNADTLAPDEKRVSLIMDRDYVVDVKYDAPMREVTLPAVGDALFIDANGGKHFYRDAKPNIVPGLTLVGFAFNVKGNKVKVMDKNESTQQWLACWQYAITAIAGASISIGVRMYPNYSSNTTVNVSLSDSSNSYINSTTATEITVALENAQAANDTAAWWAWYDSTNNRIIVQTDSAVNANQYNVVGTGCTISLCTWEGISQHTKILRKTMVSADWGVMNVAKSTTYFGTNGTTPTSNMSVNSTNLVKRACFEDSTNAAYGYCSALREEYGTYENYIAANKVKYPQNYGAFTLIDAVEMTRLWGNDTAPTKSGGIMYRFPALHSCAIVNYDADGLRTGSWHQSDISDGIEYMDDSVLPIVVASQRKMGTTQISSGAYRWFTRRNSVFGAWAYDGSNGTLYNHGMHSNFSARAVCELTLSFPSNNQNS